jgi:hypothetical protein
MRRQSQQGSQNHGNSKDLSFPVDIEIRYQGDLTYDSVFLTINVTLFAKNRHLAPGGPTTSPGPARPITNHNPP